MKAATVDSRRGEASPSLARRPDFRIGRATIRPSVRRIEGPAQSVTVEPRVLRVLLALADAGAAVLSREDLLRNCWDGAVVGDDAINRTIAEIRRIARETAGDFGVETIPRVGYRLVGAVGVDAVPGVPASEGEPSLESSSAVGDPTLPATAPQDAVSPPSRRPVSRRALAGFAAFATGMGALGIWQAMRPRADPRFAALVQQAEQELRLGPPGSAARARELMQRAVAIHAEDARAWGLLALAAQKSVENDSPLDGDDVRELALAAAERARSLDATEPNAAYVLTMLDPQGDWLSTDQRLRDVLATDPRNIAALDSLVALLQGSGYLHESHELNEAARGFDAQRPTPSWRRALKLWILGQNSEAAQAADAALLRWRSHSLAWQGVLVVYAFTGDYAAARRLVAQSEGRLAADARDAWLAALVALESRTPASIAGARTAMESVATRPQLASHAILVLSELGEVDAAFRLFESRGFMPNFVGSEGTPFENVASRWHQWLFTPATANLRADPRFEGACERLGLMRYWQRRGAVPDVPLTWIAGRMLTG